MPHDLELWRKEPKLYFGSESDIYTASNDMSQSRPGHGDEMAVHGWVS